MRSFRNGLSSGLLGLLLTACGGGGTSTPEAAASDPAEPTAVGLEVRDARAILMGATGAVYFEVVNPGTEADRLLRVESPAAAQVEVHETVEDEDVMRMVAHPDGFEVPAGGSLVLEPGGKHAMLIEPTAPEEAAGSGGSLPLTLHFAKAGSVEIEARLMSLEEAMAADEAAEPSGSGE